MSEIAIAFDVETIEQALDLDQRLGPGPEIAKVGLQLFTHAGPDVVRVLRSRGRRVFLDLKLHDIPNTVHGAAASAARLGVDLLTVHALGGEEMIAAAAHGVASVAGSTSIVAVTLLTSFDDQNPPPGMMVPVPVILTIAEMLAMALRAGAIGIVCSALDLPGVRERHSEPFFAVTPGIRPAGAPTQDQRRVTTITEAVRLGASLIVIGRPITGAPEPRAALEAARAECRNGASLQA